ncbi:hypothetical protein DFO48_1018 [Comamonas sp. AG1104]|nr:hypothetical protein DFO48_1018 [Comamonas sp. AG1104]
MHRGFPPDADSATMSAQDRTINPGGRLPGCTVAQVEQAAGSAVKATCHAS